MVLKYVMHESILRVKFIARSIFICRTIPAHENENISRSSLIHKHLRLGHWTLNKIFEELIFTGFLVQKRLK